MENNEWNASDADKAKNYNLRSNYLRAEKRTISYISLDDTHLQQIQLSHHDPYWDAEFKTLGFCGTDGRTALMLYVHIITNILVTMIKI